MAVSLPYGKIQQPVNLSGLVTCQVEMSFVRQCIWFEGQDLGTLVSSHCLHHVKYPLELYYDEFSTFMGSQTLDQRSTICYISVRFILSLICLEMGQIYLLLVYYQRNNLNFNGIGIHISEIKGFYIMNIHLFYLLFLHFPIFPFYSLV